MGDILSRPRRAIGLDDLPYDVFEQVTDNLTILDVKNLNATARTFNQFTQADWVGFLRRRLVRHCKGTRPLCFLIFLYHLEEAGQKGDNLTSEEVASQIERLRHGLANESGPQGLSESLQSLQERIVLQILCGYMDTIDEMTEDFHSQILFPKPTRKSVQERLILRGLRALELPPTLRWPKGPDISLSNAERARMQEGFLAYHILCVLAKSEQEDHRKYMSQLSSLEIERILSIQGYFHDTWRRLLIEPFQKPGWEEYRDCKIVRDGGILQLGLIRDYACGGIPLVRREFNAKREGRDRPIWFEEHWSKIATSFPRQFRPYNNPWSAISSAISEHSRNYNSEQHEPRISPEEEERQDAEVTIFWKEAREVLPEWLPQGLYDLHRFLSPSIDLASRESDPWTLTELRDCGWVFLDPAKFAMVQKHWEDLRRRYYSWGLLLSDEFRRGVFFGC